MTFRVEFTGEAEAIANRIFDWIAERAPDGAQRWKAVSGRALQERSGLQV